MKHVCLMVFNVKLGYPHRLCSPELLSTYWPSVQRPRTLPCFRWSAQGTGTMTEMLEYVRALDDAGCPLCVLRLMVIKANKLNIARPHALGQLKKLLRAA